MFNNSTNVTNEQLRLIEHMPVRIQVTKSVNGIPTLPY